MKQDEVLALRTKIQERLAGLGAKAEHAACEAVIEVLDPNGIFVKCDQFCLAQDDPPADIQNELALAYVHWRHHGHLLGCSHGR